MSMFAKKRARPAVEVSEDILRRVDTLDRHALISYTDLMLSQTGSLVSRLRNGEREAALDLPLQAEVVYTLLVRLAHEYGE